MVDETRILQMQNDTKQERKREKKSEREIDRQSERERERERVKNAIFYETIWLLKYIIFNLITFSHFVYYNLGPKANVIDYELNLQRNRQDFG